MSTELAFGRALGDDDASASALAAYVAARPAVSLERVLAVAQLTTRHELKYVVPLEALPAIMDCLPRDLAALDIDDRRLFVYQSVYFDTECFALYRQHVQGRRKRYKARTRSYCDTGDTMLEVKLKGRRGETVKERLPYDFGRRDELTCEGRAFLTSVIGEAYGLSVPPLQAVLKTGYRRTTLVDMEHGSRLTIDVDLTWSDSVNRHQAGHLALVESKSLSGAGPADALLASMGIRPVRISKYCLGVALLNPVTAANPWNRLLIRQFGWQRATES